MGRQKTDKGIEGVSYIVDNKGRRKALVIDFSRHKKAVEEFLEDLYGHQKIRERKGEPAISKKKVKRLQPKYF